MCRSTLKYQSQTGTSFKPCIANLPVGASLDTSSIVNHADEPILVGCNIEDGGPFVRCGNTLHIAFCTCIALQQKLLVQIVFPRKNQVRGVQLELY